VFPSVDHLTSHEWAIELAMAAEAPVRGRGSPARSQASCPWDASSSWGRFGLL
jgi:hypothetical protein